MALDPTTKLAAVRNAMAAGHWELAIRLAAKLRSLGKFQKEIDRANEFMGNPAFFEQMGYERAKVMDEAIAALKQKYSKSWEAIQAQSASQSSQKKDTNKPTRKRSRGKD